MLSLNKDCTQGGIGMAVHGHQCRVPVTQGKTAMRGLGETGKELFEPISSIHLSQAGWAILWGFSMLSPMPVIKMRPSGSEWLSLVWVLRACPGRGPALGFLSFGYFGSALRDMQWWKQNHKAFPEQFLSPCTLLQVSVRGAASTAAPADQFLPQFPC